MISKLSFEMPFSLPGASYCECRFDLSRYSDNCFEQYDILMPATLSAAVAKRKGEFLAGRYCAAQALKRLGIENPAIPINTDRTPFWPGGIRGSISHSGKRAAAVVAAEGSYAGLGMDVEQFIAGADAESIHPQILSENEWRYKPKPWPREIYLTLAFSAKESFYKAVYPLSKSFVDFCDLVICDLTDCELSESEIRLRSKISIGDLLKPDSVISVKYVIQDGYILTLTAF